MYAATVIIGGNNNSISLSEYDFSDYEVQKTLAVHYRIQLRGFTENIYRSCHNCLKSNVTVKLRIPQHALCQIFKISLFPDNLRSG